MFKSPLDEFMMVKARRFATANNTRGERGHQGERIFVCEKHVNALPVHEVGIHSVEEPMVPGVARIHANAKQAEQDEQAIAEARNLDTP